MAVFLLLIINLAQKQLDANIKYFSRPCCSRISGSGAELGLMQGNFGPGRRVCLGLRNVTGSEKNTQPHLAFPTQVSLRQGVLLPAPVLGRIGALFSPPPPPPPLLATNIPSPEFCPKLELLKGLLEFHGNLLWFKGTSRYFPSLIIRPGMWVVGPALDSDFRVAVVSPSWVGFGVPVSGEVYFLRVYRGACSVEGLSLGLQEPPIHRAALGELLGLWAFSS